MKSIYLKITELNKSIPGLVLATVTGNIGSTPQKPGSSALFENGKLLAGTVGGGMVESTIQNYAGTLGKTKESVFLRLQLNNDITKKDKAICGGEISILIDANPELHFSVFDQVKKSFASGIPGVLITIVTFCVANQVLVNRHWITMKSVPSMSEEFLKDILPVGKSIILSGKKDDFRSMELESQEKENPSLVLLEPIFPLPKLVIAGAGHIGKSLSYLGKMLDFEVTVIDDRSEYANQENLPDADHIVVKEIGQAIKEMATEKNTYFVIVTRGHSDDAEALKACFGSRASYIGMIGSKAKVAKMHAEFIREKWATEEQWSSIYTPIGLDIRSQTVEEIAVSIAAQLIQIRNSKD